MKLKTKAIGALALSACLGGTLAATPASAAVTSITSSSTVLDIALTVLGAPVNVGPLFPVAGTAPPAYSLSNGVASSSFSLGPLSLTTGLLSDTASGDTGTGTGTASSSIANLDASAKLGSITLLTLAASLISSTSMVNSSPSATGSTTLAGATLTILGKSYTIPLNPTVNDVVFDSGGLSIILNQQIADTSESAGITTNAIALDFTGFPLGFNLVNGTIDVAQSFASIDVSTVPETSTWAMMLLGFAGLGYAGFRKSRSAPSIV